jgi:hypothetical protein
MVRHALLKVVIAYHGLPGIAFIFGWHTAEGSSDVKRG